MDFLLSTWPAKYRSLTVLLILCLAAAPMSAQTPEAGEMLPKHITQETVQSVNRGLEYLRRSQAADGSWSTTSDGSYYPIAMAGLAGMAFLAEGSTSSRGPYADQIRKTQRYLTKSLTKSGLIANPTEDAGRPMFGHGFALLFLGTLYGMENDEEVRGQIADVIRKAIRLTARGQSRDGGWLYYPGGGDEGSVTITQMQALRACHNAGFLVPEKTVKLAIRYLERCETKEGGIRYSLNSGDDTRMPITCAAVATLYNAGAYDSALAERCLKYAHSRLVKAKNFNDEVSGHAFYSHLYAAQAFYTAGDTYFDDYFPKTAKSLQSLQSKDGSWNGDGIGPVFGTACACIILQLPYKFLPIYQR
jgi:hypothetical protein